MRPVEEVVRGGCGCRDGGDRERDETFFCGRRGHGGWDVEGESWAEAKEERLKRGGSGEEGESMFMGEAMLGGPVVSTLWEVLITTYH